MDNDYDWACRRLAKLGPVPLLCWLLTGFAQHLRFGHWLDTRTAALAGMPQNVRDTLAGLQELPTHRWWTLLLEFQLQPDPDMFGRLLIYLGTAWLELRPDPLPGSRYQLAAAVVNLTGTRESLPASWDMTLPGPDAVRCCLQVRERHLQEEAALPLLHAIQAGEQGRILRHGSNQGNTRTRAGWRRKSLFPKEIGQNWPSWRPPQVLPKIGPF